MISRILGREGNYLKIVFLSSPLSQSYAIIYRMRDYETSLDVFFKRFCTIKKTLERERERGRESKKSEHKVVAALLRRNSHFREQKWL